MAKRDNSVLLLSWTGWENSFNSHFCSLNRQQSYQNAVLITVLKQVQENNKQLKGSKNFDKYAGYLIFYVNCLKCGS